MPQPTEGTPLKAPPADGADGSYRPCGCAVRQRASAVWLVVLAVMLAIASCEMCYTTLPSVLPTLRHYTGSEAVVTLLPGIGTAGRALGKASQILVTYAVGGTMTLVAALSVGGVATLCFPIGGIGIYAVCWFVANFCAAHVWGASTRVAANWVDERYQGRAFAGLGVAGDSSQMFAALLAGAVLDASSGSAWRLPFRFTSAQMLLVAATTAAVMRDSAIAAGFRAPRVCSASAAAAHPLDALGLGEATLAFGGSIRCWLVALAGCGYSITFTIGATFAPLVRPHACATPPPPHR